MKKTVSLSFDEYLYGKFKLHCDKYGMKISSRLEVLMMEDLKMRKKVVCEAKDCNGIVSGSLLGHPIKLCKKHRLLMRDFKEVPGG